MKKKPTTKEPKWDGKCLICERPVEKADLWENGMPDSINGGVLGGYTPIFGHRTCVQNVNRYVVLPNRMILATLDLAKRG